MYHVSLDQFSGPLDLLLKLIEEEKLDISKISLAKVTDQFINYLERIEKVDLNELSDFLYLAARLLYLKSIILLPYLTPEEEADFLKLEEQLKLYQKYKEAVRNIKLLFSQKKYCFSREKFFLRESFFIPPQNVNIEKIFLIFRQIIKNLEKEIFIVKKIKRRIISLAEKIKELINFLNSKRKLSFNFLIKKAKSKLEIIINFLAILELARREIIKIEQNKIFGEIKIYKL